MSRLATFAWSIALLFWLSAATGRAQEVHEHIDLWSTEAGGGELVADWDFHPIRTSQSFCSAGLCLFSSANPAFLHTGTVPPAGLYTLVDGTTVHIELVAKTAAASVRIDGVSVPEGGSARLGTIPDLHNHPSWRLLLPEEEVGDFAISFRLISESPAYADSIVYTVALSNAEPLPTPTPGLPICVGDCDRDGRISVNEVVVGVNVALGRADLASCPGADSDGDARVSISDLIKSVNGALLGCDRPLAPTFADIAARVFVPRCAVAFCHDSSTRSGKLSLAGDDAFDQLIGVPSDNPAALRAGLLRVRAGDPDTSFLVVKLGDPGPEQGAPMPLAASRLSAQEIAAIREWITNGADRE